MAEYVGIFFLLVLGSFFIGMMVSSLIPSIKTIRSSRRKVETYIVGNGDTYFKDVPTFAQHPGVTDAEYWKAKNKNV
jgi:hypothetical protein